MKPTLLEIQNSGGLIAIYIACAIGIFLACREIMCWYFKINDMKKNQEKVINILLKIALLQGASADDLHEIVGTKPKKKSKTS